MEKRVTRFVSISLIKMDNHSLSPETLAIADYIRSGGEVPPIKVSRLERGQFRIKDGRHRVTAYKLLGFTHIKAKYSLNYEKH